MSKTVGIDRNAPGGVQGRSESLISGGSLRSSYLSPFVAKIEAEEHYNFFDLRTKRAITI